MTRRTKRIAGDCSKSAQVHFGRPQKRLAIAPQIGVSDGIIMAAIMTTHMARNDAAASIQVCPGIRIHAIDMVKPPGIGIPPMSHVELHQNTVTAVLIMNTSAETPKKACSDTCREGAKTRFGPDMPGSQLAVSRFV
jgi:hypothetical protein